MTSELLLLLATFLVFSSFFAFSENKLPFGVRVKSTYYNKGITKITCVSNQQDHPDSYLAKMSMESNECKPVQWIVRSWQYNHETKHTCNIASGEAETTEYFVLTAFDGSWKLDEIIWETYTFKDFIFSQERGVHIYTWIGSRSGLILHNFKTGKYELVMPSTGTGKDKLFVSNLFDDEREMDVVCVLSKQNSNGGDEVLAEKKALPHRGSASWSIWRWDYQELDVHTCTVCWESKIKKRTRRYVFTAFAGSWKLDEILKEPYTRDEFILNPYSKNRNFLWGVSEKGLSLYNFKVKEYQVLV